MDTDSPACSLSHTGCGAAAGGASGAPAAPGPCCVGANTPCWTCCGCCMLELPLCTSCGAGKGCWPALSAGGMLVMAAELSRPCAGFGVLRVDVCDGCCASTASECGGWTSASWMAAMSGATPAAMTAKALRLQQPGCKVAPREAITLHGRGHLRHTASHLICVPDPACVYEQTRSTWEPFRNTALLCLPCGS